MAVSSWGSLVPSNLAKLKPKEEPKPTDEELTAQAEAQAEAAERAQDEMAGALEALGSSMADWAEATSEAAPDPQEAAPKGNAVAEAVSALATGLHETANHGLEARVAADTAMMAERLKADTIIAETTTDRVTSAIADLSSAIAEASKPSPEVPDAVRSMADLLGKKIEKVGTMLTKTTKSEGARSDRAEKAITKAVTGLTDKIADMTKQSTAANATAMANMAQAITTLETRLESLDKKAAAPSPAPSPRKPAPYRFTVNRNPDTQLMESCVAEPLN